MDRSKKQRKDQQLKQSLKTLLSIEPHLLSTPTTNLLQKLYPEISEVNSLRILTIFQIIYLLQIYLEFIEKHNPAYLSQFKIGIIGCGITSRIILNSILSFQKDGLVLSNITVSTRQVDNLKFYVQNFGVKAVFDNQNTAKEADFLVIATPSTLDNWIVLDMKQSINARLKMSEKQPVAISNMGMTTTGKIGTQNTKQISSKSSKFEGAKSKSPKGTHKNSILFQKPQLPKRPFNPLIYILTSDFDQQKCKKLFPFPVLTPSIRITNMKSLKQKLKQKQTPNLQTHQKLLIEYLSSQPQPKRSKTSQPFQTSDLQILTQNKLLQTYNKYLKYPYIKIINVFSFVFNSNVNLSMTTSYSNSISNTQALKGKNRQQSLLQVLDILIEDDKFDMKFSHKLKKWYMAYNNYVS